MNTQNCENCGTPCGPDDMFCESCGYDFITGSLPDDGGAPPRATGEAVSAAAGDGGGTGRGGAGGAGTATAEAPAAGVLPAAPSILDPVSGGSLPDAVAPRIRLTISVDRAYFDHVVNEGEIDFPDPVPPETELELVGIELHIGRTSESRAIHPDIDVAELTGDQAVSSRHAVLQSSAEGASTITDVGSTNGTFLDDFTADAIVQGVAIPVDTGSAIYLGAWTRLTIRD